MCGNVYMCSLVLKSDSQFFNISCGMGGGGGGGGVLCVLSVLSMVYIHVCGNV